MPAFSADLFGGLLAWLLTVMVLSYLVRDNPMFRVATYLFVGVASGYAGAIAWHNVLEPGLIDPVLQRGIGAFSDVTLLVPWILVLLLLFKLSPATSRLGSISTALLVGVGSGVVVGGAITGTLIPQTLAATGTLNPAAVTPTTGETGLERTISVLILLIGTISTLVYFQFTARLTSTGQVSRRGWIRATALLGKLFIAVTFGVMYAGVLMATLIVLSERLQFLVATIAQWFAG
jgi:hypothetical protein